VTTEPALTTEQRVTLVELVDRVLDKGVVISGDVTLAVADVDLVYLGLRAVLASVASAERVGLTTPAQPPDE
jgi:gas vesicle structural protein